VVIVFCFKKAFSATPKIRRHAQRREHTRRAPPLHTSLARFQRQVIDFGFVVIILCNKVRQKPARLVAVLKINQEAVRDAKQDTDFVGRG
jgi:hypothetical protein